MYHNRYRRPVKTVVCVSSFYIILMVIRFSLFSFYGHEQAAVFLVKSWTDGVCVCWEGGGDFLCAVTVTPKSTCISHTCIVNYDRFPFCNQSLWSKQLKVQLSTHKKTKQLPKQNKKTQFSTKNNICVKKKKS